MSEPTDALDFLPDGTITAVTDEGTITLRRPKLGELRKIREAFNALVALDDDTQTAIDRAMDPKLDEALVKFHRIAFDLLGDKPLPIDDDDLPAWLVARHLPGKMIVHWRSVPLVRG